MRSRSGITPITIFTKPFPCGGSCIYCPKVDGIPQSYLPRVNVDRAISSYSSRKQVNYWLSHIQERGGVADKLEVIVLGGSFTAHPINYIEDFIGGIYGAIENVENIATKDLVAYHENSLSRRIIGITIETRPDMITEDLVDYLFSIGVTKIELGVQSLNNTVLDFNNRGHNSEMVNNATSIIKDRGLKVGYHLLFGMPGSTIEFDIDTVYNVCNNPDYQPDHLKLYFCEMFRREFMKNKLLYLYDNNYWAPLNQNERLGLLKTIIPLIPPFIRISRIGRKMSFSDLDSPRPNIHRQIHEKKMGCKCVRCREPLDSRLPSNTRINVCQISSRDIFIEVQSDNHKTCYGLIRLRLLYPDICCIRELHVYGQEAKRGEKGSVQHQGLGKSLIQAAEQVASKIWYARKVAIGSGIGTRAYFKRHGYELGADSRMWKEIMKKTDRI